MNKDSNTLPGLRLYYTPEQAAKTLDVTLNEVNQAIGDGELRIFDFANDIPRISRQALEDWRRKYKDVVRVRH